MRLITLILLLSAGITALAEEAHLQKAKYYQSFSSTVDASMTMVPAPEADHVYLYFEDFDGELDDFVGLYKIVRETSRADANTRYQLLGTSSAHLRNHNYSTLLAGSRVEYIEALPPSHAPVKMFMTGRADIYQARKVLKLYQQQQGLLVSGVAVKKLLAERQAAAKEACGQEVTLTLGDFNEKTTAGLLQGHLHSMARLCEEDPDYRAAIAAIEQIVANPAQDSTTSHEITIEGKTMLVSIGREAPNVGSASYEILRKIL